MNDNPDKEDVKRAEVDSARRHMSAKTDDERKFYAAKSKAVKSFKQYVKEDWKRAALMGAAATAAGAGTAAAIGFPVVAGAVIAGGQYALSKDGLRKDLRRKRTLSEKNWEKWWLKKALKKATRNSIEHGKASKLNKE